MQQLALNSSKLVRLSEKQHCPTGPSRKKCIVIGRLAPTSRLDCLVVLGWARPGCALTHEEGASQSECQQSECNGIWYNFYKS